MRYLPVGRGVIFLFLTLMLSWGVDLLVAVTIGQEAFLELGLSPLGMFFPAFVAIILRLFVFKDSLVHYKRYRGKPRWILYGFLLLTLLYACVLVVEVSSRSVSVLLRGGGNLLMTLWVLSVFFVAGQSSKDELEQAGLHVGV